MITLKKYTEIFNEVKKCINDTLIHIKTVSHENYALFLKNSENKHEDYQKIVYPNLIYDGIIDCKDESRLTFLSEFLRIFYSFPYHQTSVNDDEFRIHIELMIYTHIWESKPFLKKLYRLTRLDNSEPYCWDVVIPDMKKKDFINKEVTKILEDNNNPIATLIKKGFDSSLRNAFAHSEYSLDTSDKYIKFWKNKKLHKISFNHWSKRFAYSGLLSYLLIKISDEHRKALE